MPAAPSPAAPERDPEAHPSDTRAPEAASRPGGSGAVGARASAHEMASMFDDVSGRYDLLNRLMSLGRDRAWRRAMVQEVPEHAGVVLDLCTGSGASLTGLRRPGRLVLGVDVSLKMLELAVSSHGRSGWAPRLLCADALRLPLADRTLDCVTVAFGVRNLRPRDQALLEIARVLKPGGRLIVLEATAPGDGPTAPLHSLYVRRAIPLLGRLSPDPAAYDYLSRSIIEFGSGPEFEADFRGAGFETVRRRSFLAGAVRLWIVRRPAAGSMRAGVESGALHPASMGQATRGEMPNPDRPGTAEWRWWNGVQLLLSATLVSTLGWALWMFSNSNAGFTLDRWQRQGMLALLVLGLVGFAVRTLLLANRFFGPPPRG